MSSNICVWGHSIAWGGYDLEKGGWVNRLRLFVDKKYDGDPHVYNLGISGELTTDLLERFDQEARTRQPSAIIFQIGCNDAATIRGRTKNRVPIDRFERNLATLVRKARRHTRKILFVGMNDVNERITTPIPWHRSRYYMNRELQRYDDRMSSIAVRNHVGYLSIRDLIGPRDFSDGLHPNAHGHEKIYRAVKSYLLKHRWL